MPYHPRPEVGERFWGDYDGEIGRNIRGVIIDGINDGTRDYTDADVQHIIDMYDAEIATVDVDMGQILGFFAEQGLIDNTIFAIVSDHGEEFGEHGMVGRHSYSLHEQLIRTPLIMFGGGLPAGVDVELPSRNVDVAPTLLEFARIEVPSRMQGFDLAPLWEGTEREPRVILAEKRRYRVFIVDGFKYNTKTGELFDLRADSLERNDLRDQMPDKIVAFERLIAGWEAELARAQATVAEAGDVQLTPAEINRLKALGYLR